ncbi:MAG: tetratricopeptide repeat protein [Bacteroidota bacterium]
MKYIFLTVFLGIFFLANAQQTAEEYVKTGVEYHDGGNYDSAIIFYQKALEIEPGSLLANYEISLSYLYLRSYEEAIKHSDFIINSGRANERYMLTALMNKASCLDALGKSKEAIPIFQKALEIDDENYLLHYNLALTYRNLKKDQKAVESLEKAIFNNPNHGSSHLLLGYLMQENDRKVRSILALHFFLFLEPNSGRSSGALAALKEQFGGNVKKKDKNNIELLVDVDALNDNDPFSSVALMLSIMTANNESKKNRKKSEMTLFIENTDSFFSMLSEFKEKEEDREGLWWEFYVAFGEKLVNSEHLQTYCHYISLSEGGESLEWLKNNSSKVDAFSEWLENN